MWERQEPRGRQVWLLVSGPSGVGKTTLIEQMLGFYYPQLQPIVTATTRPMRAGEEEGKQYFFLSSAEFAQRQARGDFLETHHVHQHSYGMPVEEVRHKLELGCDLIMHVTWQGRQRLLQLAHTHPWMQRAITSVFVVPQSLEALKQRLERRGRNTPQEIETRLQIAQADLPHAAEYDYQFVSGTYQQDFQQLKAIYLAEKARV